MVDEVKQIIVVNMAVPMSIGRLAAQIAHASVLGILDRGDWNNGKFTICPDFDLRWWMKGNYTKVVCKAWGKDKLLEIKKKADDLKIHTSVMEEDGFITAISIGPSSNKKLEFSKDLALL